MALDVIFLVDGSIGSLSNFARHKERFPYVKKFSTALHGVAAYKLASKSSNTKNFYLVDHHVEISHEFTFDYAPDEYDDKFVNSWNDGKVYIFSKAALRCHDGDNINEVGSGIKHCGDHAVSKVPPDIIFISYDEPNADLNWSKISDKFKNTKRVHHVEGILAAHKQAAAISETYNFFVVDGDSTLVETFDFTIDFPEYDLNKYVYIWKCRNQSNGLEYGYGGVKLFNKKMFSDISEFTIDMSTILGDGIKLVDVVASYTNFNSDPFHAFRSAFRECTKLSSGNIKNNDDTESLERLNTWCNYATGDFAEFVLKGANLGKQYGLKNTNDLVALQKINDFAWLKQVFDSI
jgi:hypothetical protein